MSDLRSTGRTPVSVIGTGLMGSALARTFLTAGHPTTVWNRTPGRTGALVAEGARDAAGASEAITASGLVIVCVRDYDAVHDVLDPARTALTGRVLVNLTSGSSEQARAMARWATESHATYLDGAIMQTPPHVGARETAILYSGEESAFTVHRDALMELGGASTYLGTDAGIASLYDVALLGIMWGTLNSFMHAVALVGSANVDATTFLPFATAFHAATGSFMAKYAHDIDVGEFVAEDASLETHLPPVEHLLEESRALGIDAAIPSFTRALLHEAMTAGHAKDSYARIVDHFRPAR
ncbi:NAD(P)-dependent oxidoreductase [Pseudonocardia spinosispora]|uniref:NAD(P)-dependent oxidoreductase n=1 Tax=Pseudonocardia spinosispora TaxID=103441 RepID=UPI0003FF0DEE|nr:NAD(P)-binding domain-containing protein [Pseudonocardia spinosispora]